MPLLTSEPNVPDTNDTLKITDADLASPTSEMPARKKKKFQFSMKTLLLGITIAALLCAVAGWIGPLVSLTLLLAAVQVCVCGGLPILLTLSTLRGSRPESICLRIVVSVLLASSLFIISLVVFLFISESNAFQASDVSFLDSLDSLLISSMAFAIGSLLVSFFVATALVLPVLALGAFCQMLADPGAGFNPTVSRKMAAIVGFLVGGGTLLLFFQMFDEDAWEAFAFSLIPGAFGLIIPPCILALSDWLGEKKFKFYMLLHLKEQKDTIARISENDL